MKKILNGKFKLLSPRVSVGALLLLAASPAFAKHGSLASAVRDGWIDSRMAVLVNAGLADKPSKPFKEMTNLEVAQLTKKASEIVVAQADIMPPPPGGDDISLPMPEAPTAASEAPAPNQPQALTPPQQTEVSKSVKELVQEFKEELSVMGVDLAKLEDRIYDQEHRMERFAEAEQDLLKKTGTAIGGYSRGYFNTYRGFGLNRVYSTTGAPDYNGVMIADIRLKSVPVPFVLFNLDLRILRSIGMYYADPITPNVVLKWISLSNVNEVATLNAGDFYRSYTPYTLWNAETPVRTFIEPTSYSRTRNDLEELADVDHGPQWRLRGFEISSDQTLATPILSSFHLQAMGGEFKGATAFTFGEVYAGSQAAVDFFEDNLEIKGTGLMLLSDTTSSNAPYIPTLSTTFAKRYEVGSLSSRAKYPFSPDFDIAANGEWAVTRYLDDVKNPLSLFQDWALSVGGSINFQGAHLSIKYLNNGPYFYSPAAQINRFDPSRSGGFSIYDNGLNGFGSSTVNPQYNFLTGMKRPSFAYYDRMVENMLPYGDATPNRDGVILSFLGEIGKDGWLKPQASYALNMREIQPNYVLAPSGNSVLAVDTGLPTTNIRTFTSYEGALTIDLAKALEGTPSTCALAADYKHQSTDLGNGASPFAVNTMIFTADVGPIPSVPLFDGLILTAAFEQAKATGSEYIVSAVGNPPTLANYVSYLDSGAIGNFANTPLNLTRTSWAFGVKYPIGRDFEVHGDCFLNKYEWSDFPGYDRRDQIWRMTYEVTF